MQELTTYLEDYLASINIYEILNYIYIYIYIYIIVFTIKKLY